jgi:NADPH-dependent 2,4-dienoyl-CoA reductase/sulfur reductase-like enzyme/peroxiredoxin family protein/rhodanese-related sulfurtransferase/TusA-related sulfurtransferase
MTRKKVVIVGGVAGGASAAARLRRLDEQAEIILLERGEYISFANCGLPYYIGEVIQERDKLLVQTPEAMRARFAIDVRVQSEVTAVHPDTKAITVNSKDRGQYEETYDDLILSPGAKPIRPSLPGINSSRIFTLRNVPDTDRIKAFVDREDSRRAVVVGGGFIGVEIAENLKERGLEVSLTEAAPHILPPFDSDMAVLVERELEENGIQLFLGDGVASFQEQADGLSVTLQSGKVLAADLVILAIGVAPETAFLSGSGIALGRRGHILVNDRLETSQANIYAVGDAIEVIDFVSGQPAAIPLAGPANKQGRIAANNIAGLSSQFKGSLGTAILKVFTLTAAATGNNERTLQRLGVACHAAIVHPNSHAAYYPGALPLTIKLLFDDAGRILGAQAIGLDGVDKRIDVIATVIRLKGTVRDLTELELAYAPPYSSAKDPVNMVGFVAEDILSGLSDVFTYEQLGSFNRQGTILLDVRTEMEFENGHLPDAINIPLDDLRRRLSDLDKDKLILTYCQVGVRGYIASRILSQNGFRVKNMTGGYKSALAQLVQPSATPSGIVLDTETQVMRQAPVRRVAHCTLNATGLACPGPLMRVKASMDEMDEGQVLEITASDPGFFADIGAWCQRTGNRLIEVRKEKGLVLASVEKKGQNSAAQPLMAAAGKDNKTIIVFSGDFDKAMAAFIIANGAASMGKKVTMFFTFWGLSILRKPEAVRVKKSPIDRMFGWMLPRGAGALKLSKMNMLGMGTKMMRAVMKDKNVSSLADLIASAQKAGIEIIACQMTMDVMGLRKEELIDGVEVGGVGYYLGKAEDSNLNLFI